MDWNKIDWLFEENSRVTDAATRPLPPASGLKQHRLIDWLIEVKWSCYSCCNSSPPAGSWTETEEIDWLIERKWLCYSCCNSSPSRLLVDGNKGDLIDWRRTVVLPRLLVDWRLIYWWKMVVLHMLQLYPSAGSCTETKEIDWLNENGRVTVAVNFPLPPACGLEQNRLIVWRK